MFERDNNGKPSNRRFTRWFPNGAIPIRAIGLIPAFTSRRGTQGTETSKYLEEKKSIEIPLVAASESGGA